MQGLLNFRQSIQQKNAFFAAAGDAGISAVDHRDDDLAFLEASLPDSQGTLVATATATARVIALDRARSAA